MDAASVPVPGVGDVDLRDGSILAVGDVGPGRVDRRLKLAAQFSIPAAASPERTSSALTTTVAVMPSVGNTCLIRL